MYEEFYNVRTSPFALTPDPEYLVLSLDQREAIAALMYAVLARRGFSVLIGDAGTGKTTLIRTLMRWIPQTRAVFSVVVNPMLNAAEFLRTCVSDFGIEVGGQPKDAVLANLRAFLMKVHEENKVAVLIVDEAHRLSTELLEEVRLLTNFETDKEKLLQVILAGQDELAESLDRSELRQLKQRVSTRLHIKPLIPEAVSIYIEHRWRRCSTAPMPFDADAMAAIRDISAGYPRLINSICESALLLGFAQGSRRIDATIIMAVAADLHLAHSLQRPEGIRPLSARKRLQDPPMPLPVDLAQREPLAVLGRDKPRRGWRVRFGFD